MIKRKIKLKTTQSVLYLCEAVAKITDSVIFTATEDRVELLVASEDNTLLLLAESDACECNFSGTLNIPDIKKFNRIIDSVEFGPDDELLVNSNNIEYKGHGIKFKYHLYDDGFLTKPVISVDKIKSFDFDINFEITKPLLQSIIKGSTFATETNKLYLYTEDGSLKIELTDKARHNTDVFGLTIGAVDFTLDPIPMNLDNIKLLHIANDTIIKVGINTNYGIAKFETQNNGTLLKYIITSLVE